MSPSESAPVIVGVGQVLQRLDDPREAAEPLELMLRALGQAGDDCRAPSLLARAHAIYVTRGAWGYGKAGRAVADRLGAVPVETVTTPYGGNFAQACVLDAARAIQAGRCGVALVTGAENGRSQGQARRQGVALAETEAPGSPDRALAEDEAIFHDAELLTDDGARTWATVEDASLLEAMMREEFCGRRGRVDGCGHLALEAS